MKVIKKGETKVIFTTHFYLFIFMKKVKKYEQKNKSPISVKKCEFFVKSFTLKKENDKIQKEKNDKEEFFVIEVKNMTKKYGKLTAVDNISFDIKEGEIIGLLRTKRSREKYNHEYDNRIHRTYFWNGYD